MSVCVDVKQARRGEMNARSLKCVMLISLVEIMSLSFCKEYERTH